MHIITHYAFFMRLYAALLSITERFTITTPLRREACTYEYINIDQQVQNQAMLSQAVKYKKKNT